MKEKIMAAKELNKKGPKIVIATLGKEGALLVTKDCVQVFEAENAEVVDTTAAGDSFTAALVIGISEGKTIQEAIKFANKVASIVVSRKGAQTSIPTREEIL